MRTTFYLRMLAIKQIFFFENVGVSKSKLEQIVFELLNFVHLVIRIDIIHINRFGSWEAMKTILLLIINIHLLKQFITIE